MNEMRRGRPFYRAKSGTMMTTSWEPWMVDRLERNGVKTEGWDQRDGRRARPPQPQATGLECRSCTPSHFSLGRAGSFQRRSSGSPKEVGREGIHVDGSRYAHLS